MLEKTLQAYVKMTFPSKIIVSFRVRVYYFNPKTGIHCKPHHDTKLRPSDILAYLDTPIFRHNIENLIEEAQTSLHQGTWFWKRPIHPYDSYVVPKTSLLVARHEHGFIFRVGIAVVRRPFHSFLNKNFVVRQNIPLPRITKRLNELCHTNLQFDSYTGVQPDEGKFYQIALDKATLHPVAKFPPHFVHVSTLLSQHKHLTANITFNYTLPKMCAIHVSHDKIVEKQRHKLAEIKKLHINKDCEKKQERGLHRLTNMTPTILDDHHDEYGKIASMSHKTIRSIFASSHYLDQLNSMIAPWMETQHLPSFTIKPSSILHVKFLPSICRLVDTHKQGRVEVCMHFQLEGPIRPNLTTHTFLQNIKEAINFSIRAGGWIGDGNKFQEMNVHDIKFVK